jgi:protein involved in polysaccharide export with SLBB domain
MRIFLAMVVATVSLVFSGCQTTVPDHTYIQNPGTLDPHPNEDQLVILREGDQVRITFPGAPNISGAHLIGRDGNINLPEAGELKASGKTLSELKDDVLKAYSKIVDTKDVNVELITSEFPVFVSGAILQPGKILSNHPITVIEAIMERGGPDYTKADLKHVKVLRQEGQTLKPYIINVREMLRGDETTQFFLMPQDIIYIPERFNWF